MRKTWQEKLWARTNRSGGPDACWLWTASCVKGYGQLHVDGKSKRVHRLMYELVVGPIPEGLDILHSCDVRNCCNPAHLRPGTDLENAADKMRRGRWRGGSSNPGERHPNRKLSDEIVREIRAWYAVGGWSTPVLAAAFGVHQGTIWRIVRRKAWAHIE
jgi:hypothetical protein